MEVVVTLNKNNTNITRAITVGPDATVLDVKRAFCQQLNLPENQVQLLHGGTFLALGSKISMVVPNRSQITATYAERKSAGVLKGEMEQDMIHACKSGDYSTINKLFRECSAQKDINWNFQEAFCLACELDDIEIIEIFEENIPNNLFEWDITIFEMIATQNKCGRQVIEYMKQELSLIRKVPELIERAVEMRPPNILVIKWFIENDFGSTLQPENFQTIAYKIYELSVHGAIAYLFRIKKFENTHQGLLQLFVDIDDVEAVSTIMKVSNSVDPNSVLKQKSITPRMFAILLTGVNLFIDDEIIKNSIILNAVHLILPFIPPEKKLEILEDVCTKRNWKDFFHHFLSQSDLRDKFQRVRIADDDAENKKLFSLMEYIELTILDETGVSLKVSLKCTSGLYYQALNMKIKEAILATSYKQVPIERSFIINTTKENLFYSLPIVSAFFTGLKAHEKSCSISLSRAEVETLKYNLKPFIANIEERLRLGLHLKDDVKIFCPDENIERSGIIPTIAQHLAKGSVSEGFSLFEFGGKFYYLDEERKTLRYSDQNQEKEVPLQIEEVNAYISFLASPKYSEVLENKVHKIIAEFKEGLPKHEPRKLVVKV